MGRVWTEAQREKRRQKDKRKYRRKVEASGEVVVMQLDAALNPNMSTTEVASIMGISRSWAERTEWSALQKFADGLEVALADVWDSYKEDGFVN